MTTNSSARVSFGEGEWEVYLPLAPVPAARPRVSKFGTYYPKTYKNWMKDAAALLQPFWNKADPVSDPVFVKVHAVVKRPQRLTRVLPRPDVDNFAKAALDAITKAQLIWMDDDQVQVLHATKRYARQGEEPHTFLFASVDPESWDLQLSPSDAYALPVVSLEDAQQDLDTQSVQEFLKHETSVSD